MNKEKTLIVITGPTASGKSALAVDVALRLGTSVISADSRQVYADIPIATAQPTVEERRGVPHHLVGHLPLNASYSAARFEEDALSIIGKEFERGDNAVVCGGSMLYVDALCNGIDLLPTVDESLRLDLMERWKAEGDDWLLARLKELDPDHFELVDRKNLKRVFHAVEVSLQAGQPYSSLLTGAKRERPFRIVKIALTMDRERLFDRINRRVELMMEAGLAEEARRVYPLRELNSLNTVGLKEMFAWIDGVWDLHTAVARIQKNTRVYAKKQMTWHKKDADIRYVNASLSGLADRVMDIIGHRE